MTISTPGVYLTYSTATVYITKTAVWALFERILLVYVMSYNHSTNFLLFSWHGIAVLSGAVCMQNKH